MDLRKTYPRSISEKLFGVAQIARTIDKGKARAAGTLGDYLYDCSMDQAVFAFLGMNGADLLKVINNASNDSEIEAYCKTFIDKRTPAEIERWNQEWLNDRPEGASLAKFLKWRNEIAPERTDVKTWADLIDLDEGRDVPRREPTWPNIEHLVTAI